MVTGETSRTLTALVVDDEHYFRRFVAQFLRSQGVERVVEASDGKEALEIFPAVRPGLVILDINMPRSDGLEVLHGIRQQTKTVPVIMLTSVADEMVVEKCVEEGADFFIRKDVPANVLTQEMRELLAEFFGEAKGPA